MSLADVSILSSHRIKQAASVSHFMGMEAHLFGRALGDIGKADDHKAREQMAAYAAELDIKRILAINPSKFNARVIVPRARYFAGHHMHHGVTIHHGAFVDGIVGMLTGSAVWIRTADCPTVVLVGRGQVTVLHCGLKSLIAQYWHPQYVGAPNRPSVIQAAMARLHTPPSELTAHIVCGIGPRSYLLRMDHPVHGRHNKRLMREVQTRWGKQCVRRVGLRERSVSLTDIITAQLLQAGVPEARIQPDLNDTAADKDRQTGEFIWYSASRGDTERNHVLVANPRPPKKARLRKTKTVFFGSSWSKKTAG